LLAGTGLVAGLLQGGGRLAAAEPGPGVDAVQNLVRDWLALRREITRAAGDWEAQKRLLRDEIHLLDQRKEALRQELAARREDEGTKRKELAGAQEETAAARANLERLLGPLTEAEAHLRAWCRGLPDALAVHVRSAAAGLPGESRGTDLAGIGERVQLVFGLYSQLEKLDRGVHDGRMVLTAPDGRRVEMDVLFLGLAMGYAVSPDGRRAAVGRPGGEGWSWEWRPELAASIAKALAIHRKQEPAAFLALPVRVGEAKP
jgi:hypothetical protein